MESIEIKINSLVRSTDRRREQFREKESNFVSNQLDLVKKVEDMENELQSLMETEKGQENNVVENKVDLSKQVEIIENKFNSFLMEEAQLEERKIDTLKNQISTQLSVQTMIKSQIGKISTDVMNQQKVLDKLTHQITSQASAVIDNHPMILNLHHDINAFRSELTEYKSTREAVAAGRNGTTTITPGNRSNVASSNISNIWANHGGNETPNVAGSPLSTLCGDSNTKKEIDLLICYDSNFKHIDYRQLWRTQGSERQRCATLTDVDRLLNTTDITDLKYIMVSTGVNDIDDMNGIQVFNKASHVIHNIKVKYPEIKIIFSEITPRNDDRDHEVINCNKMLNEYAATQENVFVAKHENLRDESYSFFRDVKHIKEIKIPRFAANLKIALRKAHGIDSSRSNIKSYRGGYNSAPETQKWNNNNRQQLQ